MSSRYAKMKDYIAAYRNKGRQKRAVLMNYLASNRRRMLGRYKEQLRQRIIFWGVLLGGGWLFYDTLYRKRVEINKMSRKLDHIYPNITEREELKEGVHCTTLSPHNIDQVANIISLAYRYHYKVIVRMSPPTRREKIVMAEHFDNKCIFIDLGRLNQLEFQEVDGVIRAEAGCTCGRVNETLQERGYSPLFAPQLETTSIYQVLVHNYPTQSGPVSKQAVYLELLSSRGERFRSAGENNTYGEVPSLNGLFIGTGGAFAIPTAAVLTLPHRIKSDKPSEKYSLQTSDPNEKVLAWRELLGAVGAVVDVKLGSSSQQNWLQCRQRHRLNPGPSVCQQILQAAGYKTSHKNVSPAAPYDLFFSASPSTLQYFLVEFPSLPYEYSSGLLKVQISCDEQQSYKRFTEVINAVTIHNAVLVWCRIPEILHEIKPSLDSSEVGAELMHKIVEVREGLDPRNVLYSHSRYQNYFAKGLFRKMTQYFW